MMASRLIVRDGFTVTGDGFDLEIRLPWYRSLQLSVVDVHELKIDGRSISRDSIRFEVNGTSRKLDELFPLSEEFWYVLDSAVLHISDDARVEPRGEHSVDLTLALFPPYIKGFKRMTRQQRQMTARQGASVERESADL